MPIPAEVKSHDTVSVRAETTHPVPVRYSVDRDRLVCFGDGQLGDVPSGARVWASVHEIADGPPLVSFPAVLRQVDAERRATRHAVAARTGDPSLTARRIGREAARPPERRLLS
jgi:hypothetical protein